VCAALGIPLAAGAAAAQVQTGAVSGVVRTTDQAPLPGATVTVASPVLQGTRTAVTDQNGAYVIAALPPGAYTVTVEMQGMSTQRQSVTVELSRTSIANAILAIAGVSESVDVVAQRSDPIASVQTTANYDAKAINALPVGRTPSAIAALSPNLTQNTPNGGQVTIAGGFAYDNIFLINGVDVNDNLFGTATAVYIEDAVQETAVMTGGISAEYGRFSGGVVNLVTKSGGNQFAGSLRANFSNDAWTRRTPFEVKNNSKRTDKLNEYYEATLGGPIVRDRLWFFGAGRYQKTRTTNTLPQTGISYDAPAMDWRAEAKLTATLSPGHTVQVEPRKMASSVIAFVSTSRNAAPRKKNPQRIRRRPVVAATVAAESMKRAVRQSR